MKKIVLASASPRRRELLEQSGFEFDIIVSDADENINVCDAALMVRELALLKAGDVAKKVEKNRLVIGADTVVCIDGEVLGKPKDESDAERMLSLLSAREHQVYTGVCIIDSGTGKAVCKSECTDIVFKELTNEQIQEYIATGEPMDKAGAYAIQGGAQDFVQCIDGSFDNVVGLPVELVKEIIETEFSD
ncbi:MAG: septum formation inhibitor Maf [Ruminococcaceae bacterium]|nr:septum formation inhibitor Maf [Oscillospiraceae bacterium]